jgi:hypothetical protein
MKLINILKSTAGIMAATLISTSAMAATIEVVDDINGDVTWTSDNEYVLTKTIIAQPGSTLTIQPGTIIRGLSRNESTAGQAGTLVITRDARIFATGTAEKPIIFTAFNNITGAVPELPYGIFGKPVRGQWGGLIVLGRAPNNLVENSTNRFIEGLPEESYTEFGGHQPNHSSGYISYVSISHGGDVLGADNEINGLTLGSVGRGTTIQYVEVYSNLDDGVEIFGGTVNLRFIAIAYCGDDGLDTDYGWTGYVQYLFITLSDERDVGDHGSEQDSGKDGDDSVPFGIARISNATLIGDGILTGDNGTTALYYEDNCGNNWYNSIFTDFSGNALLMEDTSKVADVRARWNDTGATELKLCNNVFGPFGPSSKFPLYAFFGFDADGDRVINADNATLLNTEIMPKLEADGNVYINDFLLMSISRQRDGSLNPRPNVAAHPELASNVYIWPEGSWFQQTAYKGAFDPQDTGTWLDGWSILYNLGHLSRSE